LLQGGYIRTTDLLYDVINKWEDEANQREAEAWRHPEGSPDFERLFAENTSLQVCADDLRVLIKEAV
jgi:hypothetical protein